MSTQLQRVFNYQGSQVRTATIDGQPWFVAKDVCEVFGDAHYRRSIARLDEDEKGVTPLTTPGGIQEMTIINEPGLYSLLFAMQPQKKSSMADGKYQARIEALSKFKRWITHDVLPSIRQTGSYIAGQIMPQFYIPQTLPEALRLAADMAEQNARLMPKAEMHDMFLSADNVQPMGVVAKALGTGRNRLFDFLREHDILMVGNVPRQEYIERGYFRVKEKPVAMGVSTVNKPQTFVTAKGVDWIGRMLKKGGATA